MTIKKLEKKIGTLSNTSKMPAYSFGTSAFDCKVGDILAKIKGTTCFGCYARSGNYRFPAVRLAHKFRLEAISEPYWVDAMTQLITIKYSKIKKSKKYFRWFDSGDIPSLEALQKIFQVCKNTPDINHWLPTREYGVLNYVDQKDIPDKLIIRASAIKVKGNPPKFWQWTSTVHTKGKKHIGKKCPAINQDGQCLDCRNCWKRSIKNISYEQH